MKVRRVDYSPDEMIAGVVGLLTPFDFGIYWMVCTLIYSKGGEIEDDRPRIARIFKDTHWRTVSAALDRLIALGKVQQEGGKLVVNRCAGELQKASKRITTATDNGHQGGRPKKENNDLEKPPGSGAEKLTTNHQPPTTNQELAGGIPPDPPAAKSAGKDPGPRDLLGEPVAKTERQRKRQPLTALPEGWVVPLEWQQRSRDIEGATEDLIRHEAAAFPDYWRSVGGKKADWEATFRNRIRYQIGEQPSHGTGPRPTAAPIDRTSARRAGLVRAMADELEPGSAGE